MYLELLNESSSQQGLGRNLSSDIFLQFSLQFSNHKKTARNCQKREKTLPRSGKIPPSFHLVKIEIEYSPVSFRSLLYGPPGLGKTTLAHVVANHAGYNVVEINASDDREYSSNKILYVKMELIYLASIFSINFKTDENCIFDSLSVDHWDLTEKLTIFFDFLGSLAAFKIRLDAATQMTSVNNKDKRPNCLVIDEIDGAPSPTITYLVSLLTGKAKKKSKKGKDSNAAFLQRLV